METENLHRWFPDLLLRRPSSAHGTLCLGRSPWTLTFGTTRGGRRLPCIRDFRGLPESCPKEKGYMKKRLETWEHTPIFTRRIRQSC